MHGDPVWLKGLLAIHVVAGSSAFILAPVALITRKGGRLHKRWGKVYLWSMGVVASTALPIAIYRPAWFLALVSVLSFYLCFSGYRILKLKNLAAGGSPRPVDWIMAGMTLIASAALAGFGWFRPAVVQHMGIVAIVFGILGMRAASLDIYQFVTRPREKVFWIYTHFQRFIASYIAAWTAFSAVTLSQIFQHAGMILWLWPAAIGVPATMATTAYYKRKYSGANRKVQPSVA